MKRIVFESTQEAYWFKKFLDQKAVTYASNSEYAVTLRSPITDQQFYQLLIMFGKWI